jgi:hypothetical protein
VLCEQGVERPGGRKDSKRQCLQRFDLAQPRIEVGNSRGKVIVALWHRR